MMKGSSRRSPRWPLGLRVELEQGRPRLCARQVELGGLATIEALDLALPDAVDIEQLSPLRTRLLHLRLRLHEDGLNALLRSLGAGMQVRFHEGCCELLSSFEHVSVQPSSTVVGPKEVFGRADEGRGEASPTESEARAKLDRSFFTASLGASSYRVERACDMLCLSARELRLWGRSALPPQRLWAERMSSLFAPLDAELHPSAWPRWQSGELRLAPMKLLLAPEFARSGWKAPYLSTTCKARVGVVPRALLFSLRDTALFESALSQGALGRSIALPSAEPGLAQLDALLQRGELAQALGQLEAMQQSVGLQAALLERWGPLLLAAGREQALAELCRRAPRGESARVAAFFELLMALPVPEQVSPALSRFLELEPVEHFAARSAAKLVAAVASSSWEPQSCVQVLEQLSRVDAFASAALEQLEPIYRRLGEPLLLLSTLQRGSRDGGLSFQRQAGLAIAFFELGDESSAAETLQGILERDDLEPAQLAELARGLARFVPRRAFELATRASELAARLEQSAADYLELAAELALEHGLDTAAARAFCERALAEQPNRVSSLVCLLRVCLAQGDEAAAERAADTLERTQAPQAVVLEGWRRLARHYRDRAQPPSERLHSASTEAREGHASSRQSRGFVAAARSLPESGPIPVEAVGGAREWPLFSGPLSSKNDVAMGPGLEHQRRWQLRSELAWQRLLMLSPWDEEAFESLRSRATPLSIKLWLERRYESAPDDAHRLNASTALAMYLGEQMGERGLALQWLQRALQASPNEPRLLALQQSLLSLTAPLRAGLAAPSLHPEERRGPGAVGTWPPAVSSASTGEAGPAMLGATREPAYLPPPVFAAEAFPLQSAEPVPRSLERGLDETPSSSVELAMSPSSESGLGSVSSEAISQEVEISVQPASFGVSLRLGPVDDRPSSDEQALRAVSSAESPFHEADGAFASNAVPPSPTRTAPLRADGSAAFVPPDPRQAPDWRQAAQQWLSKAKRHPAPLPPSSDTPAEQPHPLHAAELGAFSAADRAPTQLSWSSVEPEALRRQADGARHAGNHKQLLALLTALLEYEKDPRVQSRILQEMGCVAYFELDDSALAREHLLRAMALDPQGTVLEAETLTVLEGIFEQGQEHERLHGVYLQKLLFVDSAEMRNVYRLLLGQLCLEHLQRTEEAWEHIVKVLEVMPEHEPALLLMSEVERALGRLDDAAMRLERLLEVGDLESSRRVEILLELAGLHEGASQFQKAKVALLRALRFGIETPRVLARLKSACRKNDDWEGLLEVLRRELAEHLGLEADAFATKRSEPALGSWSENVAVVDADSTLMELQSKGLDWTQLSAAELELLSPRQVVSTAQLLRESADVLSLKLGRSQEAWQAYGLILELTPEDAYVIERRVELGRQLEQWIPLLRDLERMVGALLDPGEQFELLCEAARIARTRTADLLRGRSLLERAVRLFETASQRPAGYEQASELLASLSRGVVTQLSLGGGAFEQVLGERKQSADRASSPKTAAPRVEPTRAAEEAPAGLAELDAQLVVETERGRRVDLLKDKALLLLCWPGREPEAQLTLRAALALAPEHVGARLSLVDVLLSTGELEQALNHLVVLVQRLAKEGERFVAPVSLEERTKLRGLLEVILLTEQPTVIARARALEKTLHRVWKD